MLRVGVIASASLALVVFLALVPERGQAAAGDPDYSFGGDGVVRIPSPAGEIDYFNRVAIQPDGKIVATGRLYSKQRGYDLAVARFRPNGSRDRSFDGDSGHGNGVVRVPIAPGMGTDVGYDLALDDKGRIVVVGLAGFAAGDDNVIVRLRPNGTRDPRFDGDGGNGNGVVKLPLAAPGNDEYLDAVAIQDDGAIVVGGSTDVDATAGENWDMALGRLLPHGELDPTFDGDGGNANGIFTLPIGAGTSYDGLYVIRLTAFGILVAGEAGDDGVNKSDFALARFDSTDGSLDSSFDTDGKLITQVTGGYDYASGLAEVGGGDFVATGTANDLAPGDLALLRYDSSGQLVSSFDGDGGSGNGIVTASLEPTSKERGTYLAVEPDGALVISGETQHPGDDSMLARFDPADGTLDSGFGDQGWVVDPLGIGTDRARGSVTQANGRIVAVGEYLVTSSPLDFDPYVARFHDDGKPPQTKITARPRRRSHDRTATFRFLADMPAIFRCSLDGGAFRRCGSPKTYRRLRPGRHAFRVEALDSRRAVDPTPARSAFRVVR